MLKTNPNPEAGTAVPALAPYDAVLLLSFGGPEKPEDVMPFLRNVTRGKGIPDDRLADVAEHYLHFGGRSPINDQNLDLLAALRGELADRGDRIPVLWTNRNWNPYLADTLRDLEAFGVHRVLALVTSAYASYSGCRQYREDIALALADTGLDIVVDKVRPYFNAPGFVAANRKAIEAQWRAGEAEPDHILFVTHSIPDTMQDASAVTGPGYREQHLDVQRTIVAQLREAGYRVPETSLAYCSRSGPPTQPWLEPDINDELERLAAAGARTVIVAPIGFISDHMEVIFDLDTEAVETAEELGIELRRAATAGTDPEFVVALADLLYERAARERGEEAQPVTVGELAAFPDRVAADSCRRQHGVDSGVPAACTVDEAVAGSGVPGRQTAEAGREALV